jgi:hypothetical protein
MYADRALPAAAAAALERHVATCAACAASVAQLAAERDALRAALREAAAPRRVPPLPRPLRARDVLLTAAGIGGMAWLAGAAWAALAALIPSGLDWLSPLDPGNVIDLLISASIYIATEGTTMLASLLETAGVAGVLIVAAGAAAAFGRARMGGAAAWSVLALAAASPALLAPHDARALEVRRGDLISVAAGETIDDTLIAFGENVSIDGDVRGDLVAFARRVTVRGNVTGNVVTAGEVVSIEGGTIGGSVFGAGRSVELTRVRVARNLYGAGRDVSLGSGAAIGGDAIVAADNAVVDGSVGVDLLGAAAEVEIGGDVQRNVEARARKITVLGGAEVGGDLTAHVAHDDDLQVASGATIGGNVSRTIEQGSFAPRPATSKYLTVGYYLGQVGRIAAAFIVGLVVLWLVPGLRTVPLRSGEDVLKAAGFGLVTVVTLPVAALLVCLTVVGIPLGIAGFVLWVLGLYLAKIVLAQTIGHRLFSAEGATPHYAATLLCGLVIVVIAVNVPFVGGLANLALTLIGLGMLVRYAVGVKSHDDLLV